MPRGNRRALIAAFGWLALTGANHADLKSQREQAEAQQSIADSLGNIAATYHQQAEGAKGPNRETEPCKRGDDRRYSDLCAQWKAADAAADSAWWAWASGLVGCLSLGGVLIALGLAFYSNWIARDTAKRQLRAYLSIVGVEYDWLADNKLHFVAKFTNAGQTPAKMVELRSNYGPVDWPLTGDLPVNTNEASSKGPVGPGGGFGFEDRVVFSPATLADIRNSKKAYFVWGRVDYTDVFGDKYSTCFRCYIGGNHPSSAMVGGSVINMMFHNDGNAST